MPADPKADKDFMAAPISDQLAYLRQTDPQFRDAPVEQQMGYLLSLRGGQGTPASRQALAEFAKTQRAATKGDSQYDAPLPGGALRQLLRPQNLSLEGVPETFGREGGALWSTINPFNWVPAMWQESKAQAQQAKDAPFSWANIRHGLEGPGAVAIDPFLRSLAALKDYRNISPEQALSALPEGMGQGGAQALLMRGPINKLAGTATPEAGPLLGAFTRSKAALDHIEATYPNSPVNPVPAFKIALRALQASRRGYTLPKPISDFLDHMNQGGQQPLDFQAARDFSKSLGEKIPWDQPGAKTMNGFMKQMREALEEENVNALKNDPRAGPKVADQYLKAKLEYGRGSKFIERGKEAGRFVGGYAGYELGRQFLHSPTEGMIAGGLLGRRIFGPFTGEIAKQWVDPSVLAGTLSKTAGAVSTARKAATPFAAPFTQPFQQQPQEPDEGGQ